VQPVLAPHRHPRTGLGRPLSRLAILATVLVASGTADGSVAGEPRSLDRVLEERFSSGRLSIHSAWRACTAADSSALVPRMSCGGRAAPAARTSRRLARTVQEILRSPRSNSSAAALHRAALLEFRLHADAPAALRRAIAAQERAHGLAAGDPAVLNDLAAMYLELGAQDQQLIPMLRALDAVEQAVARDSTLLPALFNHALVLDRLYLVGSARRAWERYRRAEHDPAWRREADAHLRRLDRWPAPVSWDSVPGSTAPLSAHEVAARVARWPSMAREFAFGVLGEWGRAVSRGDQDAARRLLELARGIGAAAEGQGRDPSIALAVRVIDGAAENPARVRALAQAHAAFASGFSLFFAPAYEEALAALEAAEPGLRALGSPLAGWAAFYAAASEMNLGRFANADRLYRRALEGAAEAEPALVGKAVWARGVNQVRQGNYEPAIGFYRDAIPHMRRAREPDSEGAISYLLSEALLLAGQTAAARVEEYRGLRLLSPYRGWRFLNNHLTIVTLDARQAGLEHAALAVMNEVVDVAHAVGQEDVVAWAFQARARENHALGRMDAARADLERALAWVQRIAPGGGRDRVRADVMLIRGQMLRDRDPRAALDTLATAVEVYQRIGIGMNLPAGLFEAAGAAEAAGDRAAARLHLEEAIRELERQQTSYSSPALRATRAETVEHVFDAMVRLELRAGRSASALEYLERSRMAAWARDARPAAASGRSGLGGLADRIAAALPADMLFLDYALLPDRLVVWTVSRSGWRQHTVPVSRDSVAALVERFHREAAQSGARAGEARARLYDVLIRPVAGELRGMRRLAVVPDRELFRLPFAALWDRDTGAYVVERFQVRTLPNAGFLLSGAREEPLPSAFSALVVGNPRVDPGLAPELPSLPGAAREAREVARVYGTTRVLADAGAGQTAVLEQLPRFSVFHFAGHAVFNPEQPELSYLALAAGDDDGVLQAREIGRLRLDGLRVVVLSACSTLNPRPSRAGGNAGLAYSFLRAGVPATVSTVWDVDDGATADVLVEFHRALAGGTPPAEALRQAQLGALRSSRPEMRAPAAWAAFVYTGP
jgi:CHAT domain-containing protein